MLNVLLDGSIPGRVSDSSSSSSLLTIRIGFNDLTGTIPDALGKCSDLVDSSLGQNKLAGTIVPSSLSRLSKISFFIFDANSNSFSGPLPDISSMDNLAVFRPSPT